MARLGFRVHPLEARKKKAHLKGFNILATTNETQIRAWWNKWPDADPGIVIDERLVVLDVDRHPGKADGFASLEELLKTYGSLPPTWEVSRASKDAGLHLYFRLPHGVSISGARKLAPGIDLLGNGHNLVAPGATHKDGAPYTWGELCNPETLPMTEAPQWLIERGLQGQRHRGADMANPADHARNTLGGGGDSISCATGGKGRYSAAQIRDLLRQEEVVRKCLPVLGYSADLVCGAQVSCKLHPPDAHPSAALLKPTSKKEDEQAEAHPNYLFVCYHQEENGKPQGITLPEMYFALKTGARERLPKSSFVLWSVRLLVAAGVLTPQKIHAPKLWPSAPEDAKRVYQGFVELLQIRSLLDGTEAPYTWSFAVLWLGRQLSEYAVSLAMRWLLAKGYLIKSRLYESPTLGRALQLFRLGSQILRKKLRHAAVVISQTQTQVLQAVEPLRQAYGDLPAPRSTGAPEPLRNKDGHKPWQNANGHDSWCTCEECHILEAAQERLEEKRRSNGYTALGSAT